MQYRFEVLLKDEQSELLYKNITLCQKTSSCSQIFYTDAAYLPLRISITAVDSQNNAAGITFISEYIGEYFNLSLSMDKMWS